MQKHLRVSLLYTALPSDTRFESPLLRVAKALVAQGIVIGSPISYPNELTLEVDTNDFEAVRSGLSHLKWIDRVSAV